jgi:hypothetical protein
MMSINPDAHSTDEIDLTHWGVEMARKGGVPADRVLNCMKLTQFSAYLKERRRRAKARRTRRVSRKERSPELLPQPVGWCSDPVLPERNPRRAR